VHNISDIRQIDIHTAGPLATDPVPFEFEIAIAEGKIMYLQVVIKLRQN
jgi:hypothetical protein